MKRGFTLIELIIVISVIAILAGIVTPLIGSILEEAKKSRMTAELNTLTTAVVAYNQRRNVYPTPGSYRGNGLAGSGTVWGYADTQARYNILIGTGATEGTLAGFLDKRIPTDPFGMPYYYLYDNRNATYGLGVIGSSGPNTTRNYWTNTINNATSAWWLGRVDSAAIGDDAYKCFYKRQS